jgi:hypothetical protein
MIKIKPLVSALALACASVFSAVTCRRTLAPRTTRSHSLMNEVYPWGLTSL